jgi:hypothetical protein
VNSHRLSRSALASSTYKDLRLGGQRPIKSSTGQRRILVFRGSTRLSQPPRGSDWLKASATPAAGGWLQPLSLATGPGEADEADDGRDCSANQHPDGFIGG